MPVFATFLCRFMCFQEESLTILPGNWFLQTSPSLSVPQVIKQVLELMKSSGFVPTVIAAHCFLSLEFKETSSAVIFADGHRTQINFKDSIFLSLTCFTDPSCAVQPIKWITCYFQGNSIRENNRSRKTGTEGRYWNLRNSHKEK